MHKTTLWAVLPAYNEEEALPPLLAAFDEVRANMLPNLHILIIDDGSQDRTAGVVREFAKNAKWVELVQHPQNMGLAAAMRTGLAAAAARATSEIDLVVTMDADNTHRPAEIPNMIDLIEEGLDIVIASRFRRGAKMYGIPPHRQLFSVGVSVLFSTLAPIRGVRDFSCGYRVYRVIILQRGLQLWQDQFITEQGFACMTEILYKLSDIPGVRIGETPMVLRYDQKPTATKMPVWQNIKDMFRLLRTYRRRPPTPPGQAT